jgi:transposase
VAPRFILLVLAVIIFHRMLQLITILNRCHRFPGFVYQQARFSSDHKSIEISIRPRKRSAAVCSRCHQPAPGYDQLAERRFEFIPLWGFFVFLLYTMRRVDCSRCAAVVVEEVPWADGKRTLTKAYMLFLARWARHLSWRETAVAFRTSWEKVFDAVEHVITFGLWEPYLKVIREKCSLAIHILDRFHIVAKMNKALDDVRAGESRRMAHEGLSPVLKKSRWLLLKRAENLKVEQRFRLRDLLRYNLKTSVLTALRKPFSSFGTTTPPLGPESSSMNGAAR